MILKVFRQYLPSLFIWFSLVLSAFPLLTYGLRSVLIVLWTIAGLIYYVLESKKQKRGDYSNLIVSILPFIILAFSLLYTDNIETGFKRLIQMLPLIIFPIVFYLNNNKFNSKQLLQIGWIFSISVIILVFYQITCSVYNLDFLLADLTEKEIKSNLLSSYQLLNEDIILSIKTRRFRTFLLEISDTHFTYQGLWIILSVFFMTKQLLKDSLFKTKIRILIIFIIVVLVLWLFLISSRMPIIALLVATFASMVILGRLSVKNQLSLVGLFLVLLIAAYFIFSPFRVRVNEIFQNEFEMPSESKTSYNYSSINIRNGIYKCAYFLIKEKPMLGVGVGDSQEELNSCYNTKIGAKIYTWRNYNTHNQYLFFMLSTGIVGLLFYLIVLYTHWKVAVKDLNQVYFFFIVSVIIVSLTENILSRSDGVMFFCFFGNLYLFNQN